MKSDSLNAGMWGALFSGGEIWQVEMRTVLLVGEKHITHALEVKKSEKEFEGQLQNFNNLHKAQFTRQNCSHNYQFCKSHIGLFSHTKPCSQPVKTFTCLYSVLNLLTLSDRCLPIII